MKKQLIFLVLLLISISYIKAQNSSSKFLFDEFKDAVVYLKGGQYTNEKVNINILDGLLYFIDKKDGQMKVVSGTDNLVSTKVGDRFFLIGIDGIREEVLAKPLVYVKYMAKSRAKEATVGFGGQGTLTSTTTYSRLQGEGDSMLKEKEWIITEYYNTYWIELQGKMKKFRDQKSFIKLYPKQVQGELIQYFEKQDIDFLNVPQIVELCTYADSL